MYQKSGFMSSKKNSGENSDAKQSWTYLTNYSHVVVCLLIDPQIRVKDVASKVGISERAAHHILSDLEHSNVVIKLRKGRRNLYKVHTASHLRHPLENKCTLRAMFTPILKASAKKLKSGKVSPVKISVKY